MTRMALEYTEEDKLFPVYCPACHSHVPRRDIQNRDHCSLCDAASKQWQDAQTEEARKRQQAGADEVRRRLDATPAGRAQLEAERLTAQAREQGLEREYVVVTRNEQRLQTVTRYRPKER